MFKFLGRKRQKCQETEAKVECVAEAPEIPGAQMASSDGEPDEWERLREEARKCATKVRVYAGY